jgi:hypothetical protein
MARRIAVMTAACALGMPVANAAGANPAPAAIAAAPAPSRAPVIKGGHDKQAAWMVADYRQLQLRKRTDRTTHAIAIALQVPGDTVSVTLSQGTVTVTRGGKTVVLDSAEAMAPLQRLLGGSLAVFATRSMLSELEQTSELTAPDMSLLSAAAFVSSLVGDVDAPQRLADRFMAKHRGLYRQVRMPAGTCWASYTSESTAAWNQLQDCMADANERDFLRAAYERLACNGVWLARTESAWFEYLNCLSPLSSFNP